MGAHLVRRYVTETDTEPDPKAAAGFDPQLGFAERKERGLSPCPPSPRETLMSATTMRLSSQGLVLISDQITC